MQTLVAEYPYMFLLLSSCTFPPKMEYGKNFHHQYPHTYHIYI